MPRITDHRGRRVPLVGFASPETLAGRLGLSKRAAERVRARAHAVNTWTAAIVDLLAAGAVFILALPLLGLALWGWNVLVRSAPPVLRLVSFAVPIGATIAVLWWISLLAWVPRVRGIVRGLLAEGRCPSCGYDIRRCSPEADGCTVCPECGAAWRVPAGSN